MSFYARNINGTEAQFIISSHKLTYKNIWFFKDNFINLHLKKNMYDNEKKKKNHCHCLMPCLRMNHDVIKRKSV